MVRSSYNYTQLGIGDCGHVVVTWPQVAELGGKNPEVVCEQCTREKYGLTDADTFLVWVRLKETSVLPKPKVKRVRKPKPLTPWQKLLREEGLF